MCKMKKMRVVALFAATLPFGGFASAQMAWADVPKCSAWKLPTVTCQSAVAEWHEMEGGLWFTNSVGEKISVECYNGMADCAMEFRAVPMLDRHYDRCKPRAVRMLCSGRDDDGGAFWSDHYTRDKDGNVLMGSSDGVQKEVTAWRVSDNVCLLLCEQMCRFYFFDGRTRRHIVDFDGVPLPKEMDSVLALMENPDAVNNLAVMIHSDEAWSHSVADSYVERLLMLAASFGSAKACDNLVVLGQEEKWSKARIDRWRRFAKACREAAKDGIKPKMELKCISDWPLSWID